ncbi:MAG: response regulator transcription factor [Chloroflexi bacterium]|nr:response regulator transcription factor [Chloroflexota bacterium]
MSNQASATLEYGETDKAFVSGYTRRVGDVTERERWGSCLDEYHCGTMLQPDTVRPQVHSRCQHLEVILVLAYDHTRRRYGLIQGGETDSAFEVLEEAVALAIAKQIQQGKSPIAASRREKLPAARHQLSRKEVLVLQAVADGLTNRAIASRLHITENTAKRHLQSIFAKLGVSSRTQAAMVALAKGWISPGTSQPAASGNLR